MRKKKKTVRKHKRTQHLAMLTANLLLKKQCVTKNIEFGDMCEYAFGYRSLYTAFSDK